MLAVRFFADGGYDLLVEFVQVCDLGPQGLLKSENFPGLRLSASTGVLQLSLKVLHFDRQAVILFL